MKHLHQFINWLKGLFSKKKEEDKEEEVIHFEEIPLQDAYKMWRMEQRKKESLSYNDALKKHLDNNGVLNKKNNGN